MFSGTLPFIHSSATKNHRLAPLLLLIAACTACMQPIEVAGNGSVLGAKTDFDCSRWNAEERCNRLVIDTDGEGFRETYVAIANKGWVFTGWENCPEISGISGHQGNACTFELSSAVLEAAGSGIAPSLRANFDYIGHEASPFPEDGIGLSGSSLVEHLSACHATYVQDRPEPNLYEQSLIEVLESTIKITIMQYRDENCQTPYEPERVIANQVNFEVLEQTNGNPGFEGYELHATHRFIVRVDGWLHSAEYYAGEIKGMRTLALAHGYRGAAISTASWPEDSYVAVYDLSESDFDWSRSYFTTSPEGCPETGIGAGFCE